MSQVTQILTAIERGDARASDELLPAMNYSPSTTVPVMPAALTPPPNIAYVVVAIL